MLALLQRGMARSTCANLGLVERLGRPKSLLTSRFLGARTVKNKHVCACLRSSVQVDGGWMEAGGLLMLLRAACLDLYSDLPGWRDQKQRISISSSSRVVEW